MGNEKNNAKGSDYKRFATPRIIGGIAIAVIILWALSIFFGSSEKPASEESAGKSHDSAKTAMVSHGDDHSAKAEKTHTSETASIKEDHHTDSADTEHDTADHGSAKKEDHSASDDTAATHTAGSHDTQSAKEQVADSHQKPAVKHASTETNDTEAHGEPEASTSMAAHQPDTHGKPAAEADTHGAVKGHPMPESVHSPTHKPKPKGVAFVEAAIQPLEFELEERWWGWRANDLINLTDNVESIQMGVLEVTRRTTVALAERISRTGTTDSFDENLEQAMNWFMIKSSSFWFPSAESKYRDGLEELSLYLEKLKEGKATFYTRTDNLIPLLSSFEDLLGSCDENLVKHANEDGTPISSFAVDNYFYYTQGVASSMAVILEAVHHDFLLTLESRHGTELLHHAIISCQRAAKLDPWIVLDKDLSSIFANHRANMAAPISHARFYLGQLIKTLST